MKPLMALLLVTVCWTPAAVSSPTRLLTPDGLLPVRIGMTRAQAETALGFRFKDAEGSGTEGCEVLNRRDGRDSWIWYMLEDGKISRIAADVKGVQTPEGIRLGSTEKAIKQVYGREVSIIPNTYDDDGHNVSVGEKSRRRGYVFITHKGRVVSLRAGLFPSIQYDENCL